MGRDRGEDLAADALDVAGTQVVSEQAADISRARRMAEGRRKRGPREDRMRRQEAGRRGCMDCLRLCVGMGN